MEGCSEGDLEKRRPKRLLERFCALLFKSFSGKRSRSCGIWGRNERFARMITWWSLFRLHSHDIKVLKHRRSLLPISVMQGQGRSSAVPVHFDYGRPIAGKICLSHERLLRDRWPAGQIHDRFAPRALPRDSALSSIMKRAWITTKCISAPKTYIGPFTLFPVLFWNPRARIFGKAS